MVNWSEEGGLSDGPNYDIQMSAREILSLPDRTPGRQQHVIITYGDTKCLKH